MDHQKFTCWYLFVLTVIYIFGNHSMNIGCGIFFFFLQPCNLGDKCLSTINHRAVCFTCQVHCTSASIKCALHNSINSFGGYTRAAQWIIQPMLLVYRKEGWAQARLDRVVDCVGHLYALCIGLLDFGSYLSIYAAAQSAKGLDDMGVVINKCSLSHITSLIVHTVKHDN